MFSLLMAEFHPKMGNQPHSSSEFSFRSAEEFVTNIALAAKGRAMVGLHFSISSPLSHIKKGMSEEIESKN